MKECIYNVRNANAKRFFEEFQRDPERHAKILVERALRWEIKRILNTNVPYAAPTGFRQPKPEPVDEEPFAHEFMYRLQTVVKEEAD